MDFRKLRKRILEAPPDQTQPSKEPEAGAELADAGHYDTEQEMELVESFDETAESDSDEAPDDVTSAPVGSVAAAFLESDAVTPEAGFEVLRFRLAHELFCLELDRISEIIKPRQITPVPRTPDWLLGIVSLRGTMIPVVDTATRLKVRSAPVSTRRIIIIEHENELCGLLVDEVQNVEIISPDAIEPLPTALADRAGQFLEGLMRLEDHLIALIDIEATLQMEDDNGR
ncbi:MAG: hypothetical protein D6761_03715 [Candidatus Dadabacteria bacterium]|nr:MAG: hypothetical protein D6761_03715 [Candidatus Dadabacteria bacterium]